MRTIVYAMLLASTLVVLPAPAAALHEVPEGCVSVDLTRPDVGVNAWACVSIVHGDPDGLLP